LSEIADSCVQPAKGPIMANVDDPVAESEKKGDVVQVMTRVGKEAPDFEASAFVPKVGFKNLKLSDYRGQWVVLCFYPGDFTFV